ncbi:hypothetical protein NC652_040296 [Populus alba x Populus x berolinensis]|nr:hypothetical protein NC652_040296 [Populus alba x Populus x berolinensis]
MPPCFFLSNNSSFSTCLIISYLVGLRRKVVMSYRN